MLDAVLSGLQVGLVGIVSHGTAMSLLLEHLGLVDASDFWATLRSPDAWLVDGPTLTRLNVD